MADRQAAIAQFMDVTGASKEAATFFLDSSGGEVDAAIDQFFAAGGEFEAAGEGVEDEDPQQPPPELHVPPVAAPAHLPQAPAPTPAPPSVARAALGGGGGGGNASAPGAASASGRRAPAPARGNVRSLADLGADKEDSDEDDRNEYYAGGEKSGQVVKGAPNPREHVEDLFTRARRAGAQDGPLPQAPLAAAGAGRSQGAFQGTARTLAGDSPAEQAQQQGEGTPLGSAVQAAGGAAPDPQQPIVHTIAFYSNGIFTVDDGDPRRLDDPSNRAFLDSMARGECPAELEPPSRSTPVNVNLVRHEREWVPPERPRYTAFSGTGRVLTASENSPAPSTSAASAPVDKAPVAPAPSSSVSWEGPDESKESTSLQLRLADGSRIVARFNTSHTVADVRRFIRASRPDTPAAYRLVTAFPPAQLDNDAATIASAGLANAVIIQKL